MAEPMHRADLTEIDERAAYITEYVDVPPTAQRLAQEDVPALLAEVERLRAERNGAYTALRDVLTAKPATLAGAASAAAKVIRNHSAERDRVLAERDRLAEQVKHVRAVIAWARTHDEVLLDKRDATPSDNRARRKEWEGRAYETRTLADRLDKALDEEPTP